jgi:hypothetical protein
MVNLKDRVICYYNADKNEITNNSNDIPIYFSDLVIEYVPKPGVRILNKKTPI